MSVLDLRNHPVHGFDIVSTTLVRVIETLTGKTIGMSGDTAQVAFATLLRHNGLTADCLDVVPLLWLGSEPAFKIKVDSSGMRCLHQVLRHMRENEVDLRLYARHFDKGEVVFIAPENWRELPVPPMPDSTLAVPQ